MFGSSLLPSHEVSVVWSSSSSLALAQMHSCFGLTFWLSEVSSSHRDVLEVRIASVFHGVGCQYG